MYGLQLLCYVRYKKNNLNGLNDDLKIQKGDNSKISRTNRDILMDIKINL